MLELTYNTIRKTYYTKRQGTQVFLRKFLNYTLSLALIDNEGYK
ncbi:hypothetical protein SC371_03690 [Legionella pneumophila serogroup 2]